MSGNTKGMKYIGIAFFDLDGTIANCRLRLKNLRETKDYDTFYDPKNVEADLPIPEGIELLKMMRDRGYKIIVISSRRSVCIVATMSWLRRNGVDVKYEDIYLRGFGDNRKSWDVKRDLMDNAIADNTDLYLLGKNYFVDDYPENCIEIAENFADVTPLCFGVGRLVESVGGME